MGLFRKLTGGKAKSSGGDGSKIPNASSLVKPTHPDALSPYNINGALDREKAVRSVPVWKEYRDVSDQELGEMETFTEEYKHNSKNFRESLKMAAECESEDGKNHEALRGYQTTVAKVELQKTQADAKVITALNQQRPEYAGLLADTQRVEFEASRDVARRLDRVRGLMGGR